MIEGFIERCLVNIEDFLRDNNIDKTYLTDIIFTGGSTRIPYIRAKVQEFLGLSEEKLHFYPRPEEVIAYGAACRAAQFFDGRKTLRSIKYCDPEMHSYDQTEPEIPEQEQEIIDRTRERQLKPSNDKDETINKREAEAQVQEQPEQPQQSIFPTTGAVDSPEESKVEESVSIEQVIS